MHLKTCVILWYLFKTKIKFYTFFFYPFLGIFFNPPKHPNYKSYHSNFFSYRLALKNWAMNIEHAFQPYDYSPRPFSRGPLHRFRPPPSLYRVLFVYLLKSSVSPPSPFFSPAREEFPACISCRSVCSDTPSAISFSSPMASKS